MGETDACNVFRRIFKLITLHFILLSDLAYNSCFR